MKAKVWTLCTFLELGTKHPWKGLQRQSLELRWEEGPSRDSHNQGIIPIKKPPDQDTIAYARKVLLTGH